MCYDKGHGDRPATKFGYDLQHRTIHFSPMLGARPYGWEYPDGDSYATLQLPGALHVNSAQTYDAAAVAGLGLIQAPLLGIGYLVG
jgi:hypothetical protein